MDGSVLTFKKADTALALGIIVVLFALLGFLVYQLIVPVSKINHETDETPYEQRTFRQLQGVGYFVIGYVILGVATLFLSAGVRQ